MIKRLEYSLEEMAKIFVSGLRITPIDSGDGFIVRPLFTPHKVKLEATEKGWEITYLSSPTRHIATTSDPDQAAVEVASLIAEILTYEKMVSKNVTR